MIYELWHFTDIELGKIPENHNSVEDDKSPEVQKTENDGKGSDEKEAENQSTENPANPANGDVLSDTSDIKVHMR